MSYDNTCKYLAEQYPLSFARWLLNTESENISVLKTELSTDPLRADSLVLLQISNQILQIEFQTLPYSKPPIPNRMLEYKGRLIREYGEYSIVQVVIFLKSINSELVYENQYQDNDTLHQYRVIRLWEQDPAKLLASSDLLPLAALAQSNNPNALLEQVAERVARIDNIEQRQNILACSSILAGLRFSENFIHSLFREEFMRESVIYQDILQQGLQQGLEQGLEQGRLEGRQTELLKLLRRQLTRRLGEMEPQYDLEIQKLSISQLEDLGEALLEFSSVADLAAWLNSLCS